LRPISVRSVREKVITVGQQMGNTTPYRELTSDAAASNERRHERRRAFLDGELHELATAFENIADDLSSSSTPPPSDSTLGSTTGSPESVCARWIHHHLSHLQAGVDSLAQASAVVRSGVLNKHAIVQHRRDDVGLDGPAEEVALSAVATKRDEPAALSRGLDALGDRDES